MERLCSGKSANNQNCLATTILGQKKIFRQKEVDLIKNRIEADFLSTHLGQLTMKNEIVSYALRRCRENLAFALKDLERGLACVLPPITSVRSYVSGARRALYAYRPSMLVQNSCCLTEMRQVLLEESELFEFKMGVDQSNETEDEDSPNDYASSSRDSRMALHRELACLKADLFSVDVQLPIVLSQVKSLPKKTLHASRAWRLRRETLCRVFPLLDRAHQALLRCGCQRKDSGDALNLVLPYVKEAGQILEDFFTRDVSEMIEEMNEKEQSCQTEADWNREHERGFIVDVHDIDSRKNRELKKLLQDAEQAKEEAQEAFDTVKEECDMLENKLQEIRQEEKMKRKALQSKVNEMQVKLANTEAQMKSVMQENDALRTRQMSAAISADTQYADLNDDTRLDRAVRAYTELRDVERMEALEALTDFDMPDNEAMQLLTKIMIEAYKLVDKQLKSLADEATQHLAKCLQFSGDNRKSLHNDVNFFYKSLVKRNSKVLLLEPLSDELLKLFTSQCPPESCSSAELFQFFRATLFASWLLCVQSPQLQPNTELPASFDSKRHVLHPECRLPGDGVADVQFVVWPALEVRGQPNSVVEKASVYV